MSCPDCFTGDVQNGGAPPKGRETTLHGLKCYISDPLSLAADAPAKANIIFITDAFGWTFVNSRKLADEYASRMGFRVVVPDFMEGNGAPLSLMNSMYTLTSPVVPWYSLSGQFSRIYAFFQALSGFVPWIIRNRAAVRQPTIVNFTRAFRGATPGVPLGTAGFCWGGRYCTLLCSETATKGGNERVVDASFAAHPSWLKIPDDFTSAVTKFNVPWSLAIGDKDFGMPKDKVDAVEAALRQSVGEPRQGGDGRPWYDVQVYEGCSHGFAVRAKPGSEVEKEAAEAALKQAVEFFRRFLGVREE